MPASYSIAHDIGNHKQAPSNYSLVHISAMSVMQPHELIAKLLAERGLNPNAAAKAMCNSLSFQPTLHKFLRGDVASPKRATAERIAKFLELPVDAIYDSKVATEIARQRGLAVPERPAEAPVQPNEVRENIVPYSVQQAPADPFPPELRRRVAALGRDHRAQLMQAMELMLAGFEAAATTHSKALAS